MENNTTTMMASQLTYFNTKWNSCSWLRFSFPIKNYINVCPRCQCSHRRLTEASFWRSFWVFVLIGLQVSWRVPVRVLRPLTLWCSMVIITCSHFSLGKVMIQAWIDSIQFVPFKSYADHPFTLDREPVEWPPELVLTSFFISCAAEGRSPPFFDT